MATVNSNITFQAATVLNSLVKQATGQSALTQSSPGDFASVAQVALTVGWDPILNAVSNMWGKTIMDRRPYSRKFKGMAMDADKWGAATRKLTVADGEISEDAAFKWPVAYDSHSSPANGNGKSVDMYVINKPDVLQTAFYGASVWQDHLTLFRDQFWQSFRSAAEFMAFQELQIGTMADKHEQYHDTIARGLLANYIGSLLSEADGTRVIKCLTEYNNLTGLKLTAQTVYLPDNFAPFMRWLYARIQTIKGLMSERSVAFQTVVNNKFTPRHTPANKLRVYMLGKFMDQYNAMVLADTRQDDLIRMADVESITFYQSIKSPDAINVTPVYTDTAGAIHTGEPINKAGIIGVICDQDAFGYGTTDKSTDPTPLEAKGRYSNIWWHETFKTRMDMTQKGVVLLLE